MEKKKKKKKKKKFFFFFFRLLRRRSRTECGSARFSSARRRAIRGSMARSARCGSRFVAAYFVGARGRNAGRLASPQHGGARSGVRWLAPLAADRALWPPTSSALADGMRVGSLLLSTAARDPGFDGSLRSLRIALCGRLLRRRSRTKCGSARFSSARGRAIRGSMVAALAGDRALWPPTSSALADENAGRLASPQHGGARSGVRWLAPLAADRALWPPTSSALADEMRVGSLLLSTAARNPGFDGSLRSLRIALCGRLLRRRSRTKCGSARFSSARRRAIRGSIARSALSANWANRRQPAGLRMILSAREVRPGGLCRRTRPAGRGRL